MPTQARCDRVPPPHAKWDALDLRVLQEDDLPLGKYLRSFSSPTYLLVVKPGNDWESFSLILRVHRKDGPQSYYILAMYLIISLVYTLGSCVYLIILVPLI